VSSKMIKTSEHLLTDTFVSKLQFIQVYLESVLFFKITGCNTTIFELPIHPLIPHERASLYLPLSF
jgi:hypothetical protein